MLLRDETCALRLTVTGYEFPHATEPTERFSRHVLEGEVSTPDGVWRFRHPALTCEETPMVAMWLSTVADWLEGPPEEFVPAALRFTEPNLALALGDSEEPGRVTILITLDREFRPPWRRSPDSAHYTVSVAQDVRGLRRAAAAWFGEIATYPDGLEQLADGPEAE